MGTARARESCCMRLVSTAHQRLVACVDNKTQPFFALEAPTPSDAFGKHACKLPVVRAPTHVRTRCGPALSVDSQARTVRRGVSMATREPRRASSSQKFLQRFVAQFSFLGEVRFQIPALTSLEARASVLFKSQIHCSLPNGDDEHVLTTTSPR